MIENSHQMVLFIISEKDTLFQVKVLMQRGGDGKGGGVSANTDQSGKLSNLPKF
jgi:hypothetical protein